MLSISDNEKKINVVIGKINIFLIDDHEKKSVRTSEISDVIVGGKSNDLTNMIYNIQGKNGITKLFHISLYLPPASIRDSVLPLSISWFHRTDYIG